MAIVKMKKITIVGLESNKPQIIKGLMRLGNVEVANVDVLSTDEDGDKLACKDGDETSVNSLEADISRVDSALAYLRKHGTLQKKKKLFQPKRTVDDAECARIRENAGHIWEVVRQIEDCDRRLAALQSEENRLSSLIASLKPWEALDIPLDTAATRSTDIVLGVLPALTKTTMLAEELYREVPESHIKVLSADRDQQYLFVVFHKSREEDALRILKQYGFSKVLFKELCGTAGSIISESQKRIQEIAREREEVIAAIAALGSEKPDMEVFHDNLLMERDGLRILERLVKTEKAFMLEGWVPEKEANQVKQSMLKQFDCYLEIEDPKADEEYPILLENPALVQPFEVITEMYSLPKPNGIDPNFVMAPFYFLFFGMMVSDAGYGLVMALVTGIFLMKFKPQGLMGKMMKLLFMGGVSTFIWGALFGGWFGNIADILTGKTAAIKPLWFNPLDDPMRLLIWSFIFGTLHIFAGMGIKAYMMIKDGHFWDAVFDIFSWYFLIVGLALLAASGTMGTVGKYLALAGALILVLTQGRSQKNILKKFTSGLLSLYNITGFLSDILSYSRLLALGLATGVIATVINTMGSLFGFGIMGILILIVVFTVGTVFNIAINALGAYVHASRLQYVEFFSKFYEGGGKAFEPFKINSKYIHIIDRRQN